MSIINGQQYRLMSPDQFTSEHIEFLNNFKLSVSLLSSQTDIILGAKDIHSKHFISTDAYAKLVALPTGEAVANRYDVDMPCEGTVEFADCYVREDQELLQQSDINKKVSVLNIHQYGDGVRALVFEKCLLKHHLSQTILGTIYSAKEVDISNFFAFFPNSIFEFHRGSSIEAIYGVLNLNNIKLSEYEHEVCFLLILNWDFKQIADFFNKHQPLARKRSGDTIYKCKNRICDKLDIPNANLALLRETLVGMGVHRKIPQSFFNRLLGSHLIIC
ncbi:hypothetical protein ACO0K0_19195 [Undibacterium sp. SXout11W]|uniref:hypothetical protein n=1 Tax=Undibacterium sp. SXout11W TaxID=3413050 RepID=UPI003BF0860F